MSYSIIILGYVFIAMVIRNDYRKVINKYNVRRNGFRFIIRDNKGRFVKLPRNNIQGFFTLITLAYED